ncbi:MAG: long-chain-fatty-acid--CoA ligase [Thermoproteota archaeon]
MMDYASKFVKAKGYRPVPLILRHIVDYAAMRFPTQEIVYRNELRTTYSQFYDRLKRLAGVLEILGVKKGDSIGVLDWNTYWHMELGFGIPCYGAIYHPINARLPLEQMAYIINDSEDKVLFFNEEFAPIVEKLVNNVRSVEKFVLIGDKTRIECNIKNLLYYEDLMSEAQPIDLQELEEDSVGWIYHTSGTTGLPKGAYFTHKMAFLHTVSQLITFTCNYKMNYEDVALHAVPMYHLFAWGYPYLSTLFGQKQVLPGRLRPDIFWRLVEQEKVTWTAMVATVLRMMIDYPEISKHDISSLRLIGVGGGPLPRGLYEEAKRKLRGLGAERLEIYAQSGMTEIFTYGTSTVIKKHMETLSEEEKVKYRLKAGLPVFLMQAKVVDDNMKEVPRDGTTVGRLFYRSPFITPGYIGSVEKSDKAWINGWFNTGDLATWDKEGYLQIVDRDKDAVKSGGEWISTLQLESLLSTHPAVSEVAVIGVPHKVWGERPVAIVKLKEEYKGKVGEEELKKHLENFVPTHLPKWWIPDKFVFVEEIVKTGTGKFDKKVLREQFKHLLESN